MKINVVAGVQEPRVAAQASPRRQAAGSTTTLVTQLRVPLPCSPKH